MFSVGRFLLALLASTLITTIVDIVINAVVLRDAFIQAAAHWRPAEELNRLVPLGVLSLVLMQAAFGALYCRVGWRGVRRGVEFGSWIAIAAVVGVAGMATLVPWPSEVLIGMATQQAANAIVLGLVFGAIYHPDVSLPKGVAS